MYTDSVCEEAAEEECPTENSPLIGRIEAIVVLA